MSLGFASSPSLPTVPRPGAAPTQAALSHQLAQGGGSDVARDRLVHGESRARALAVTGARLSSQRLVARSILPAGARRA